MEKNNTRMFMMFLIICLGERSASCDAVSGRVHAVVVPPIHCPAIPAECAFRLLRPRMPSPTIRKSNPGPTTRDSIR